APEPARLHELSSHHPAWVYLEQCGSRYDAEPGAPGAEVLAVLDVSNADVGEQPGEHGSMDLLRRGRLAVADHLHRAGDLAELALEVLPLAHPQVVEELGAAQFAELVRGKFT